MERKKGINTREVMKEDRVPETVQEKNSAHAQWEAEALLEKTFSPMFFKLKTGI